MIQQLFIVITKMNLEFEIPSWTSKKPQIVGESPGNSKNVPKKSTKFGRIMGFRLYTHCFPIRNASIRNSTENLGFFKKWVVKTLQLRNEKTVPNKIKKCHYSQKFG